MKKIVGFFAVLAFTSSVFADAVAIKNASFEDPVQDPGAWTNTYPDWEPPTALGDAFVEYITGFVSDGVNHLGIQNGEEVSQDLGVTLLPNSVYELTVGVGNRNANFTPTDGTQQSTFGLYVGGDAGAGGTLVADATVDAGPLGESTFADFSLTYATGETVPAGNLFVSLRTTGNGRAHYDNIRLSVVPEPSSAVLLCLAGLGLVAQRRRR